MTMNGSSSREPRHPIRVVARRTGITVHVLRAWERRYAVVEPGRTAGGQRLYSDADIERLKLLRDAVASGRSISQVATLRDEALAELVTQDRASGVSAGEAVAEADSGTEVARYLSSSLQAAERMDDDALHRLLLRALVSLRPVDFIEGVVEPLLYEVGERWHQGQLRPSHEHAVSIAVRRVLTFLLSAYEPKADAPTLVTTTITGDPHEFGAMLASVLAGEAGWRVLYLGASLPADEIARAAAVSGAAAVAVSAVDDRGAELLVREFERLRAQLPDRVRVLAGGRAVEQYASELGHIAGLEVIDLQELRETLPVHGRETAR